VVQLDQLRYLLKAPFISWRHHCCPASYSAVSTASRTASRRASNALAISCTHCHMPSHAVSHNKILITLETWTTLAPYNIAEGGVICYTGIRLLFTYIVDRGCVSLSAVAVGSISVHAWCIGDDFMYVDQYCSCSISIAYRFMSGSLRMP
jgi:hypothetical protein